MANYGNAIAMNPKLAEIMPEDKFYKQMAFDYDIDLESIGGMKGSLAQEKAKLIADIHATLGTTPMGAEQGQPGQPGQPTQQPAPQGANQQAPDIRSMLQGVRQPTTPNINDVGAASKAMM